MAEREREEAEKVSQMDVKVSSEQNALPLKEQADTMEFLTYRQLSSRFNLFCPCFSIMDLKSVYF